MFRIKINFSKSRLLILFFVALFWTILAFSIFKILNLSNFQLNELKITALPNPLKFKLKSTESKYFGKNCQLEKNNNKLILLYTYFFGRANWGWSEDTLKNCPQKCEFTYDRGRIKDADAVVFNAASNEDFKLNKNFEWPTYRRKSQIYVFYLFEPPLREHKENALDLDIFPEYFFNWTMTYRKDSDVHAPFGRFIKLNKPKKIEKSSRKLLRVKKPISWLVSRCNKTSGRDLITKRIQDFIKVDIYGKCANSENKRLDCGSKDCYEFLAKKYKFYLAFENSLCPEYISEKAFKAAYFGMLPIVYGMANYENIFPKNSYINIKDFKNIQRLIHHLKFLDENDEEFLKYFEWTQNYSVSYGLKLCDLCLKLHETDCSGENDNNKSYKNVKEWWNNYNFNCLNAKSEMYE